MKKLIALIAALVLVAGYANAAEWNFYGSARVNTLFTDSETVAVGGIGTVDVTQFAMALQGNSRIGANVKVSDELSGRFEFSSGVATRLLYGTWNFGAGALVIGQAYTPLQMLQSNQMWNGDNDLVGQGGVYAGRAAQLKLVFGDFQVAAIAPSANITAVTDIAFVSSENTMPRIEASYGFKMNNFKAKVAGGYNTQEVTTATSVLDVDSWVAAINASANFGALSIAGAAYTGVNSNQIMAANPGGLLAGNGALNGVGGVTGTAILDDDCMGFSIIGGYKVSDMLGLEIGYGKAEVERDTVIASDEVTVYYAQAVITLAPGVFIVPEFGVIDNEEIGIAGTVNEINYFTAKWQINF